MNLLWSSFLRYCAAQAKAGSVRSFDGLEAAWANATLPFTNGTWLSRPVESEADLAARLRAAHEDAAPRGLPWGFFAYEPYLAGHAIGASSGLAPAIAVRVMTGDTSRLAPPARPLPTLEYRRVAGPGDAHDALDLNMRAYGLPTEMTANLLEAEAFYRDARRDFGYVAYLDGEPVSTTTVVELEGWLYVALVATAPDRQQKGYAEAVMRHALAEAAAATGLTRTSLDATDMGAPVYQRMGYTATGEVWTMYTPTP